MTETRETLACAYAARLMELADSQEAEHLLDAVYDYIDIYSTSRTTAICALGAVVAGITEAWCREIEDEQEAATLEDSIKVLMGVMIDSGPGLSADLDDE